MPRPKAARIYSIKVELQAIERNLQLCDALGSIIYQAMKIAQDSGTIKPDELKASVWRARDTEIGPRGSNFNFRN